MRAAVFGVLGRNASRSLGEALRAGCSLGEEVRALRSFSEEVWITDFWLWGKVGYNVMQVGKSGAMCSTCTAGT